MSLLLNLTIGYDVRDSCNDEFIGLDEAWDFYASYIRNRKHKINTPTFLGIVGPAYVQQCVHICMYILYSVAIILMIMLVYCEYLIYR